MCIYVVTPCGLDYNCVLKTNATWLFVAQYKLLRVVCVYKHYVDVSFPSRPDYVPVLQYKRNMVKEERLTFRCIHNGRRMVFTVINVLYSNRVIELTKMYVLFS